MAKACKSARKVTFAKACTCGGSGTVPSAGSCIGSGAGHKRWRWYMRRCVRKDEKKYQQKKVEQKPITATQHFMAQTNPYAGKVNSQRDVPHQELRGGPGYPTKLKQIKQIDNTKTVVYLFYLFYLF